MVNSVENISLPPGWDIKYDPRTRRNYFINYINKTTTWEDPRQRHINAANAPPQFTAVGEVHPPVPHGSTDPRQVYPSYPSQFQPQHAFQLPNPYMQELQRQEMSNGRPSPVSLRAHTAPIMGSHAIGHSTAARIQETSFSNQSQVTDDSVAKISAMFPTVSETHIRTLLLKYHNREAVVISALQVEKNPITTPGPYTPPTQRHILPPAAATSAVNAFQHTPSASLYSRGTPSGVGGYGGSGVGVTSATCTSAAYTSSPASSTYLGSPAFRHSPRPQTSPKMKLRYMKSLFPKADETVILDTLYAADDNLKSATDLLLSMGYEKRDTMSAKGTPQRRVEIKAVEEKAVPAPPRVRSLDDKQRMRERLAAKYSDLADQLINMALESTDFDEDRAAQILNMTKDGSRAPSGTSRQSFSAQQTSDKEASDSAPVLAAASAASATSNAVASATVAATSVASNSGGDFLDSPSSSRTATTAEIGASGNEVSTTSESPRKEPTCTPQTASEASSVEDKKSSSGGASSTVKVDIMISKRAKGKKEVPKVSRGTSTTEDKEFRSPLLSRTSGPDPSRHRGPNDDLLLEDYVTWTGPNPSLLKGRTQSVFGSTSNRLNQSKYTPRGPNPELRKGPKCGLAKGSIYSHLTASVIAGGVSCGK